MFCIDFRGLNKITVFDAGLIPNVEDLLVRLAHSRFFTKIDLAKGYWQILVLPEDRPKTAFATHQGLLQFIRMPFGLVSAPAVFARMMRILHLADLSTENFFDDILVHSVSWSNHLHHVRNVLDRLKSHGLTARPSKILAGFQSLEFLGHVVGSGVLPPDESKTKTILQVSTPTTKKQVRSLLGLLSFYRRYIPGFASEAAPLVYLIKEGGRSCRSIHWTPDCASAQQEIQAMLSRKPVLLLPRLDLPFVLQTDASSTDLGAVLLQEFEDSLHPVCFASRKLLDREKRYSTLSASVSQLFGQCTNLSGSCGGSGLFSKLLICLSLTCGLLISRIPGSWGGLSPFRNSVLRFSQSLVRRMCSLTFCLGLQLIR